MNKLLDILLPRFVTEDIVANGKTPFEVEPFYKIEDVYSDETFDFVIRVKSFNFFGIALFQKMVGYQEFKSYVKENNIKFKDSK